MQLTKVMDLPCPIEAGLLKIARQQCKVGAKIFLAPLDWTWRDGHTMLVGVTVEAIYDDPEAPVAICRDAKDERWGLWL